jgi:hypothetical protein
MARVLARISRDEAFAAFLRLGAGRSLRQLHRYLTTSAPGKRVSLRTIKEWSRRGGWIEKAVEFDTDAAQRLVERAKNDIVDEQFDRIRGLRVVVQHCLDAAGAIDIDLSSGTAAEVRTLTTTAIDAIKMIEVLTGGVSDRTESARSIAAEAKELLQNLERQKRGSIAPQALHQKEEKTDRVAGQADNIVPMPPRVV